MRADDLSVEVIVRGLGSLGLRRLFGVEGLGNRDRLGSNGEETLIHPLFDRSVEVSTRDLIGIEFEFLNYLAMKLTTQHDLC